jgi:hypothetical protein
MLSILRFSSSGLGSDSLGEALLNLTFLRLGINRARSIEELPDHLRRDVGLLPRTETRPDLRDWRW